MLRKFLLKDKNIPEQDKFAVLTYDEEKEEYHISIPHDIPKSWLPLIPMILMEKGIYEIDDEWARKFVKERVIPPERQNIGTIMRDVGMKYYDEFPLFVYCSGRCCQDDFYAEEIT